MPGVAEERLHGDDVETAANLIRPGDREALAGGGKDATFFESGFQCCDFGFDAL